MSKDMKRLATGLVVSGAIFAFGCYLVAFWSDLISQSVVATYSVMGIIAVALLTWPIFAVRLLATIIDGWSSSLPVGFLLSGGIFAVCCYLEADWSGVISQSAVANYTLLGVTIVSLLAWPLFAVRLLSAAINRRIAR
jgi:hypothetical protein